MFCCTSSKSKSIPTLEESIVFLRRWFSGVSGLVISCSSASIVEIRALSPELLRVGLPLACMLCSKTWCALCSSQYRRSSSSAFSSISARSSWSQASRVLCSSKSRLWNPSTMSTVSMRRLSILCVFVHLAWAFTTSSWAWAARSVSRAWASSRRFSHSASICSWRLLNVSAIHESRGVCSSAPDLTSWLFMWLSLPRPGSMSESSLPDAKLAPSWKELSRDIRAWTLWSARLSESSNVCSSATSLSDISCTCPM
mmetsp:Transcript_123900/g.350798  ORF Transcript_123900/g.350798 Transcript_123900/m.350798 type:complete len:255 (-) Transcript_123900:403-1167(-)